MTIVDTLSKFVADNGSLSVVMASFVTGVLGPVVVLVVQAWLASRSKKNDKPQSDIIDIKKSLKESEAIHDRLGHIMHAVKADRVSVKVFHNGGKNVLGKSLEKVSTLYEHTSPGVEQDIFNFQNVPVSFFSNCLKGMEENKESRYEDIARECRSQIDGAEACCLVCQYHQTYRCEFRQVLHGRGVLSAYFYPIFSFDDKFIGFIGAEYIRTTHLLPEESKIILQKEAERLGGYLDHREIPRNAGLQIASESPY